MKKSQGRFPDSVIGKIYKDKILGIRAGKNSKHRVIGIWAVAVDGRIFVRSYQAKPGGWWQTLIDDPHGILVVGGREIPVRAIRTRSEKLKDLVSAAYKEKYNKPGDIRYVKDMSRKKSRDTTTELVMR